MKLNKYTSYVLLHLLNGANTASQISQIMPTISLRTVQRALLGLTDLGLITREGVNNPIYTINYGNLIAAPIGAKVIEDDKRPSTGVNHQLFDWLEQQKQPDLLRVLSAPRHIPTTTMTAKELEYLTVELSWKSSALEGNTYSLLDTQLLLTEGIRAKDKTSFETQMILNHKNAISFMLQNKDLFAKTIAFSTLEELHSLISFNLNINSGVRKRLVRISASNYTPAANPHQLRGYADRALGIISNTQDPFLRSLLALSLIPYLQIFEDGNKRTGRLLANAVLISAIGTGFSLRNVSGRQLAMAYLAFYEFNSLASLRDILLAELP